MQKLNGLIGILMSAVITTNLAHADDWVWTDSPTPGAFNAVAESDTGPTYANGTLSDDILLSEILPNPEGSDTENEWIELYNRGDNNIDLGNWILDDEEGGSPAYTFPAGTVIEAQDFLVVPRPNSGLSLNNDTDRVRLYDFENTLKEEVVYESSPEGQSYARVMIEDDPSLTASLLNRWIPTASANTQETWEWTRAVTVGSQNPFYRFLEGTVATWLPFEDAITLKTDTELLRVELKDLGMETELKNSLFEVGKTIQGVALRNAETGTYRLTRLDDTVAPEPSPKNTTTRYGLLLLLTLAALYGTHRWQRATKKAPTGGAISY